MRGKSGGKGLAPRVGFTRFRGMCNAGQLEATVVCVISSTNPLANCKVSGNEVAQKEKRMLSSGAGAFVVCRVLTDLLLNSSGAPSASLCVGYLAQEPAVLRRPCFTTAKKLVSCPDVMRSCARITSGNIAKSWGRKCSQSGMWKPPMRSLPCQLGR